jgi:UDP-N-acetylmuramoyl-L-alanyl-D-glutamate--2,6-diaminopimelate ligase
MKLNEIINMLEISWSENISDLEIKDIEYDSRQVQKGMLFFAVKGGQDDGNLFINESLDKGAVCVVASSDYYEAAKSGSKPAYKKSFERIVKEKVPFVVVNDVVDAVSKVSASFYGYPSRSLSVIGVTGTNGKTSTTYILEAILKAAGFSPGVIGTIQYRYAGKEIKDIEYTTPKSLYIQRTMKDMVNSGVTHVAMEVSSHGIALGRVGDIDFDAAIFTHLTRDHMEFHKDMEDYFTTKKRLFTELLNKSTKKNKVAIVNIDCPYGARLVEFIKLVTGVKLYTYGFDKKADMHVDEHEYTDHGSMFTVRDGKKSYNFELSLIGKHNIYNALSSIALAMKFYGIKYEVVRDALAKEIVIPGRLERVEKGYNIFVDYAHTDDSLLNVLSALRNIFPDKRIITVFGCGGDRDKGKRPKMGKVVSDLSDYSIVTSDNPRHEEPMQIIESIVAGMRPNIYEVIPDRQEAIKKAIKMMDKEKDVILIAGKGHEAYQLVKGVKHDFDDRLVARLFIHK